MEYPVYSFGDMAYSGGETSRSLPLYKVLRESPNKRKPKKIRATDPPQLVVFKGGGNPNQLKPVLPHYDFYEEYFMSLKKTPRSPADDKMRRSTTSRSYYDKNGNYHPAGSVVLESSRVSGSSGNGPETVEEEAPTLTKEELNAMTRRPTGWTMDHTPSIISPLSHPFHHQSIIAPLSLIPHSLSLIPYPLSLIPYPSSLISLIPYPLSLIVVSNFLVDLLPYFLPYLH